MKERKKKIEKREETLQLELNQDDTSAKAIMPRKKKEKKKRKLLEVIVKKVN